jgi:ankyrin repeat protein
MLKKKSLIEKDVYGRLPVHYACKMNASVEMVQLLLRASICDRLERLGLEQWKTDVEELISSKTMEEDSTSREMAQEIYERLSEYEEMGRISLSELATAWRASCHKVSFIPCKRLRIHGQRIVKPLIRLYTIERRERRIKSGTDAIIHGVLPFLKERQLLGDRSINIYVKTQTQFIALLTHFILAKSKRYQFVAHSRY